MNNLIFLLLIIFSANFLSAQSRVFPFKKNNKWGIIDENQKVIKEPSFDNITFFINHDSENAVSYAVQNSKRGLLNREGKAIIPFEYDFISLLRNFTAATIRIKKKVGIFNLKERKVSIPVIYEQVISREMGRYFTLKKMNDYGISDINHKIIVPIKFSLIEVVKQKDGSIIYNAELNNSITVFNEKGHILKSYIKEEKVDEGIGQSFMDMDIDEDSDSPRVAPINLDSTKLQNDIKLVNTFINEKNGERIGLVRKERLFGLIDEKSNLLTSIDYLKIKYDRNESGLILHGKYGLFGWFSLSKNKVILQPEYEKIEPAFRPWSRISLEKKIKNYLFLTISEEDSEGGFFDINTGQIFLPKK
jgi:hypothetical protein